VHYINDLLLLLLLLLTFLCVSFIVVLVEEMLLNPVLQDTTHKVQGEWIREVVR
jgi:hypothetical protein